MAESTKPRMFYFGPWGYGHGGHFLYDEEGNLLGGVRERPQGFPWNEWSPMNGVDNQLQPGCVPSGGRFVHSPEAEKEGEALLHYKAGWTALSFWDRSVDSRPGCNSTYFAEGMFTFEQMVEMAKVRFRKRWSLMKFEIRLVGRSPGYLPDSKQ
jgi:hypothetical protein